MTAQTKKLNAVANFISSMDLSLDMTIHLNNLRRDKIAYAWEEDTCRAIEDIIIRCYFKEGW